MANRPKLPLVLHIGAHKTGTTTIQGFLRSNEDLLREAGILYPRAGCVGPANHSMLAWATREDPRAEGRDHWQEVFDEIEAAAPDHVLLSGEEFEFLSDREVERLHGLLADRFDVRVVYYIRRQDEIMVSEYLQWIKTGVTAEPFAKVAEAYLGHQRFQYARIASIWDAVFGRENLSLRSFSRARLVEGDLLADFREAARLPLPPGGETQTLNVSPGRYTLLCGKFVEAMDMFFGQPVERRDNYLEILSNQLSFAGLKEPRFQGFSEAERLAFLASFAPDNAHVAEVYLGGETPFPGAMDPRPEAPPVPLDPQTLGLVADLSLIAWRERNPQPQFRARLQRGTGPLAARLQDRFGLGEDRSSEIVDVLLSGLAEALNGEEEGRVAGLGAFRRRDMPDGRRRVVLVFD